MWRLESPGSLIDPLGELATFLWYTAAGDQVCVPTRSVGCDAMMDYRMEEIYGLVDEALKAASEVLVRWRDYLAYRLVVFRSIYFVIWTWVLRVEGREFIVAGTKQEKINA
jgi:hypothetical protein